MKSAWGLTGLMGLIAAAFVLGALVFPWPAPVESNIQVNQKLFADVDVNQVRNISIISYDRDNRRFENIQLKRVRDSWFSPTYDDYPAGNVTRIAGIFSVVGESTILEVKSSDESTHALYGVIDSDLVRDVANQAGIGTKIILADTNNRPLAQLIVGETVGDNPNQRFVRVAGQPNVYVVELPGALLSTQLTDWVDHNLLGLKVSETGSGLDVERLQIDHYIIEGDSVASTNPEKKNYRALIDFKNAAAPLTLFKAGADGNWGEPVTNRKLNPAGLNALAKSLTQIPFSAVVRVPEVANKALLSGLAEDSDLKSLAPFGFRKSDSSPSELDSKNGQLVVSTSDGMNWTLSFGSVTGVAADAQSHVNYYLLITAAANEAAFPLPPEPTDKDNEDQKRDFDRALKRREDNLAAVKERANQYNQRVTSWLYLISEDALLALRPDEAKLVQ